MGHVQNTVATMVDIVTVGVRIGVTPIVVVVIAILAGGWHMVVPTGMDT